MTHIFLYGPPGTGKTTVGQAVARNLKMPFIDLDRVIEANVDMTIQQIMDSKSESVFRDMETAALNNCVNEKESIIALGGGALLRDENRALAESSGKIILLMAELETLLINVRYWPATCARN
jgi:shikimate kinase